MDIEIKKLSVDELNNKIQHNPDLVVINILSKQGYEDCHIKHSMNISIEILKEKSKKWKKDKEIVVYCDGHDCSTGIDTFNLLQQMGFKNIYSYDGGMEEWHAKDYPVNGPCELKDPKE